MTIHLDGCAIEESEAEWLCSQEDGTLIYMIDELPEMYLSSDSAMEAGNRIKEDWVGDMYVTEYSINIGFDPDNPENDDSRGYYLRDYCGGACLIPTGKSWRTSSSMDYWEED